jgi:hypothetical protein
MVNHGGSEKAQPGMAMIFVIPGEELPGMRARIFQASEAFRKVGPVFQRSEMALRVGIIVRDVRAAVGFGDPHVRQQKRDTFDVMDEPRSA